jgi:hypothetical protein
MFQQRNGQQNGTAEREMVEGAEDHVTKHIHWKRALPWAQDTLICREILAQLVSQSIGQPQQAGHDPLITICTERSVTIALFDNLLLRIELRLYPFQVIKPFLNTNLLVKIGNLTRN